jgi:hypothetical protein
MVPFGLRLLVSLVLVVVLVGGVNAQELVLQTAGVGNNKMGPYRALAQLAFAASQKEEHATVAMLAKILERSGRNAEDYGGDTALSKTNHAPLEEIDSEAAYSNYLENLKLAD